MADNYLSESQLLLLANYEYFHCLTNNGTIKENIDALKSEEGSFDMDKVVLQGATGDIISEEDAVDILNRLENDSELSNLRMARNINKGGIRATLYTDSKNENPTLVFRGTGGTYKAWKDNVLGEYETDTRLQTLAADFVKYECAEYSGITVTGHSKGGNLSQYVTVVCAEQIDRCISYDGQGFGDNFLKEHKEEIKVAKDKITSISGFNDFVNILLTPIAGSILYVKNQEGLSVDMHSCYTMLSNGSFDENGDFNRAFGVLPQLPAMTMAKWASDGIVKAIELLPGDGNEKASNLMAAYVASIFSADQTDEFESKQIDKAINDFKKYYGGLISLCNNEQEPIKCLCSYNRIYIEKAKAVYKILDKQLYKLKKYPEYVEDFLVKLDLRILGRSYVENSLKIIISKLDKNIAFLERLKNTLLNIISKYESADMIT